MTAVRPSLILNIAQIHVAATLGQKRFRERAEVHGRDENRSLGLTSPKMMDEQISEQSGYRCKSQGKQQTPRVMANMPCKQRCLNRKSL